MAHSTLSSGPTNMTAIPSTASQWPQAVAAAGAWWEEANGSAPQRVVSESRRPTDDGEWPGVAAAAVPWWDESAPRRARRAAMVKVRAREASPAQWPEVAAVAGVWWEETFESGVYAKRRAQATLVA